MKKKYIENIWQKFEESWQKTCNMDHWAFSGYRYNKLHLRSNIFLPSLFVQKDRRGRDDFFRWPISYSCGTAHCSFSINASVHSFQLQTGNHDLQLGLCSLHRNLTAFRFWKTSFLITTGLVVPFATWIETVLFFKVIRLKNVKFKFCIKALITQKSSKMPTVFSNLNFQTWVPRPQTWFRSSISQLKFFYLLKTFQRMIVGFW